MILLPLDDLRWAMYRSGYGRRPYNLVPLIHSLLSEGATSQWWETIWDDLHHQGDLGEASYAIIPYLVNYQQQQREIDEQLFHFACVVDLARPENGNPPIPPELELGYELALRALPVIGTEKLRRGTSENVVMGVAAATALASGHRILARAYLEFGNPDALIYLRNLNGFEPTASDS